MLLPIVITTAAGIGLVKLLGPKKRSGLAPAASRSVVEEGPASVDAWSWRVLAAPGGYLGQWRPPYLAGFAPTWIDVPAGVVPVSAEIPDAQAREYARNLALEQLGYAQMGVDVVDSGTAEGPIGVFAWQVIRTPQGLYQGQVQIAAEWINAGPALTSPHYARNLALEAIAQMG